jgi:hypothetical protein
MSDAAFIVTDHAVVRWLQRVHGVEVDFFREEIASIVRDALYAGAKSLRKDGFEYQFHDGKLMTIVPIQSTWESNKKVRAPRRWQMDEENAA